MSQTKTIHQALKRGEKLTTLAALRKYGTLRLGARIWDLKQAGVRIKSKLIEVGDGKRVAQYELERKAA
jgi:hypothetical protein